jgi:hypothetical protein
MALELIVFDRTAFVSWHYAPLQYLLVHCSICLFRFSWWIPLWVHFMHYVIVHGVTIYWMFILHLYHMYVLRHCIRYHVSGIRLMLFLISCHTCTCTIFYILRDHKPRGWTWAECRI